ncbi:MAG: hypothetical protein GXZ14_00835 [Ruminococcaceae bacterium]|nr:hypothetical protein [Oscillospiraceae bacterium]
MAGTFTKPKAYNRRIFINFGTETAASWAEVAAGITSRGASVSEQSEDYYDMAGRGVAETETTGVKIGRTFSGYRVIGDTAQDEVFWNRMTDLNKRQVEVIEFYDNITGTTNGRKGTAAISISDDGSGDATARENISFGYTFIGEPKAGKVTLTGGVPTFTDKV